jgi:hypothetical protein
MVDGQSSILKTLSSPPTSQTAPETPPTPPYRLPNQMLALFRRCQLWFSAAAVAGNECCLFEKRYAAVCSSSSQGMYPLLFGRKARWAFSIATFSGNKCSIILVSYSQAWLSAGLSIGASPANGFPPSSQYVTSAMLGCNVRHNPYSAPPALVSLA